MVLNVGYIEGSCQDSDIAIRVYYDPSWLDTDSARDWRLAPLINGPRGYCLDITNKSGRKAELSVTDGEGTPFTMVVQKGDPVTTGPQSGRSRTVAQMVQAGYTTRGSIGTFQLSCD